MSITVTLATSLLLMSAPLASGGSNTQTPATTTAQAPEQKASDLYNTGLRLRDKAWKFEAAAEKADGDEQTAKLQSKAAKQYSKAIKYFELATEKNRNFFQAYGSLGYALRKTGDHAAALTAYDHALAIEPTYTEAIEYRAEAYLALDRVDDARQAYMALFADDRARADELMVAMQAWVARRRATPGELASDLVEQFADWLDQRGELAGQATAVSQRREWN